MRYACTAATPIAFSSRPPPPPFPTLLSPLFCPNKFYFLLACRLPEPALCQCTKLIQSPLRRLANVMTHDIQLMLFPSW